MARKNWRDSASTDNPSSSGRSDWSGRTKSKGIGTAGKTLVLLAMAGLLGALFVIFSGRLRPEPNTRLVFCDSYPSTQGEMVLSSNAYAPAIFERLDRKTNIDLITIPANLRKFKEDVDVPASGPNENVVLVYVYTDIFLDNDGKPFMLSHDRKTGQSRDSTATQSSTNTGLREFLEEVCRKDVGKQNPEDPLSKVHRIVILDYGRSDAIAFSSVCPEAVASGVKSVLDTMRDSQVPNSENLWVMLAADNFQLGWTSPELNGSVFGYFFSQGLSGKANPPGDEDQTVTLAELNSYVRESVARWVENYRDAVQTPLLLCGGDLKDAANIQLIHAKPTSPQSVSGFQNQKTLHDGLWQEVYKVRQPHRRQMICSLLTRLEQLRYCDSQEYNQLTNRVKALLSDSVDPFQFDKMHKTSVFDVVSDQQLADAIVDVAIEDFKEYLKPKSNPTPAATESETDAKGVPDNPDTDSVSTQRQKVGAPPVKLEKKLGRKIMHLSASQRLALSWHYVIHRQPAEVAIGKKQLAETLDFIRNGAASQECDSLVEMQFLDLLFRDLPWGKNDFNDSILSNAVRCFDTSQSLIHANLESEGDSLSPMLEPNDAWLNWRHIDRDFEKLELRRRVALDKAIAGQSASSVEDFNALLVDYNKIQAELLAIVRAREAANQLLFVIPYLKSFSLRDAIYREHEESESEAFCLPLDQIAALEKIANEMMLLLSGSAMSGDEKSRLKIMNAEAEQRSEPIRDKLNRVAIESAQSQSASRYVFEAQNLLITPIPEWIDFSTGSPNSTRPGILGRLDKHLKKQQSDYFDGDPSDDSEDARPVNEIAASQSESAINNLAEFEKSQLEMKPVETLATSLGKNASWSDVQSSVSGLATIEQLKNRDPASGLSAFENESGLASELLRLDTIERQIRFSDRSIGLAISCCDISQQQIRLGQFDAQRRMLVRAIQEFWGAGDVAKNTDTTPPFMMQVQAHAHNLTLIAQSMDDFRLDGKQYRAYDSESLSQIGQSLSRFGNESWSKFARLQAGWRNNEQSIPPLGKLNIEESATNNQLAMYLDQLESTLSNRDFFPTVGNSEKLLIGQRVELENKSYFDAFEIPATLRNSKAWGTIHFRGHQFKNGLAISRKFTVPLRETTFTFKPKRRPNQESLIRVDNDVENEVDLIFLLDCSQSIKNQMKDIKAATLGIMEQLAGDQRFHIGLAAFGHRGEFTNEKLPTGKHVLVDGKLPFNGVHPFDDWEMMVKPSRGITDGQMVNDLNDFHLSKLTPRGYTPLYYSIKQTLPYFSNASRGNMLIVVTDGENQQFANDPRAIPKGKQPTTRNELETFYAQKFQGKVDVLVLQTKRIANDMPASFTTVSLGPNTAAEMKKRIFDAVGRFQFSVSKVGAEPSENDRRRMGETVHLKIERQAKYQVQAHGVPEGTSTPQQIMLDGGEDYRFFYTKNGLRPELAESKQAADEFLRRIEKPIQMRDGNYLVGRIDSNQPDNVRIGFANKRGLSQYPERVWARIRDIEGREFDVTRPTREFSRVPTFNFQMPDGMDSKSIDMTLYVKPDGGIARAPAENEQDNNWIELKGESSGEFQGLSYLVSQDIASPTRFKVTISSKGPLVQSFYLDCPNSIPIGDEETLTYHSITFEDVGRAKEVFEFEIPETRPPTFKLFVLPKVKFEAAIRDGPPAQDFKQGIDPIYGDDVIAIQLNGIQLRN